MRTRNTVIAALAVYRGDADAMICGVDGGDTTVILNTFAGFLGLQDGISDFSSINLMLMPSGNLLYGGYFTFTQETNI